MKPRSPPKPNHGIATKLFLAINAVLMICMIFQLNCKNSPITTTIFNEETVVPKKEEEAVTISPDPLQATTSSPPKERSFYDIAVKTKTDKVEGHINLATCLATGEPCIMPKTTGRDKCKTWGHFYDTLYQRWLEPFSRDDSEPFQFLEIGFYQGSGFAAFQKFLPRAEAHSIEFSCTNEKDNTARAFLPELFDSLRASNRMHCGSAADISFLDQVWTQQMHRPDGTAPPLKVVVDDASHLAIHMVQSVLYWFPKIEPHGVLIVEDIQPIPTANAFRTQFLPQIMSDLHWCGHPDHPEEPFFETIVPLIASVSCEMHICIFERNEQPAALDLPPEKLTVPPHALDYELALKTKKSDKALK